MNRRASPAPRGAGPVSAVGPVSAAGAGPASAAGAGPASATEVGVGAIPNDLLGRGLYRVAYALALFGGVVVFLLSLLVVVSILGRAVFSAPIPGDFELVAMGTAISVSAFLPYCHFRRGNVIADLFLARASPRVQTALDGVASALLAVIAGVLAWRTVLGALDMVRYEEVTMILGMPVWWAFPLLVCSLALLAAGAGYTALRDAWAALSEAQPAAGDTQSAWRG